MIRLRSAMLLLLAAALAACENSPIEPIDEADDFALSLVGPAPLGIRPAPLTLPALLHGAIHDVYTGAGPDEARSLVRELSRLQTAARAASLAGRTEEAASLARLAHAERLRIVLAVFGDATAARVLQGVRAQEALLHQRASAATDGLRDRGHLADLLAQTAELLARADAALDLGDNHRSALDHATRAAALLDAARAALSDAARIPGLDEIFRAAAARLTTAAAEAQLAEYTRLQLAAEKAARSGDRARAHTLLEEARAEQIRLVLTVFGADAGRRMLAQGRTAAADVLVALRSARAAGRDLSRLERMHATARDMLVRADAALAGGDARTALDLGSHAVSLLNALRLTLAGQ